MTIPTINLELMLAGWQESHSGGAKLTFWLPDGADLEPFKLMTSKKGGTAGQRFMAAMALIGDDEQPVGQQAWPEAKKAPLGPFAKLAVQLCKNPDFTRWIRPHYDRYVGGSGQAWGDVTPDDDFGGSWDKWTRHAILVLCECQESRRELDTDPNCGRLFEVRIRKPWAEANA